MHMQSCKLNNLLISGEYLLHSNMHLFRMDIGGGAALSPCYYSIP